MANESFTPFGSRRNPATWSGAPLAGDLTTSAGITRKGYTFQSQLGLWMGLNHMNRRVQDDIMGRFLSDQPLIWLGNVEWDSMTLVAIQVKFGCQTTAATLSNLACEDIAVA